MTAGAFVAAAVLAGIDWWAVHTRNRPLEYVAKPAVMIALVVAAMTISGPSGSLRAWFSIALVLSLAGDVFLMLERERFVAGLASFLGAHLAYIGGLTLAGVEPTGLLAGSAVAMAGVLLVGRRIVTAAGNGPRSLRLPVAAYVAAISGLVVAAVGTRAPVAVAGALLFYASDATLGWNRFIRPTRRGPLTVIVTYHLGQALLVASLAVL